MVNRLQNMGFGDSVTSDDLMQILRANIEETK